MGGPPKGTGGLRAAPLGTGKGTPRGHSRAPCLAELQMMVEHHLCKQARGEEDEEAAVGAPEHSPGCCHHGDAEHSHSPGGGCPLAQAQPAPHGGPADSE